MECRANLSWDYTFAFSLCPATPGGIPVQYSPPLSCYNCGSPVSDFGGILGGGGIRVCGGKLSSHYLRIP